MRKRKNPWFYVTVGAGLPGGRRGRKEGEWGGKGDGGVGYGRG